VPQGVVARMRFDCQAALDMAVENHVCEVQLVLRSMLPLQVPLIALHERMVW
jgi:hypothetical protein